jgi:hypothetical protein
MATSGTATWNPNLQEIFDEAFERAGLEMRVGYDYTTAVRSFQLLVAELANRGLNLWTFSQGTLALVQGTASYALPLDTVDVLDGVIRTNSGNATSQADLVISRTSFSDYVATPNKLSQGRPTQYTILRETAGPVIYFYQVPDGTQPYVFYYLRLRRIQDAGTVQNTLDVPIRFLDSVIAGLAYRLASKRRESMALVPQLKQVYEEALELAQSEDRDRSSISLLPYIQQGF